MYVYGKTFSDVKKKLVNFSAEVLGSSGWPATPVLRELAPVPACALLASTWHDLDQCF